jgi:hypothetical protein
MKISEKQALIIIDILKETTKIDGDFSGYTREFRLNLYNDILRQQDDKLIELDDNLKEDKI